MAVRTPVILWTLRLSMMTTSPGFRVGTRELWPKLGDGGLRKAAYRGGCKPA
jgi:hypothetical protein